jgi:hypothetical protein
MKYILEEHYDFYFLPNVIYVISWRGMRWAGNWRNETVYEIIVGTPQGKKPLMKVGAEGRTLIKYRVV